MTTEINAKEKSHFSIRRAYLAKQLNDFRQSHKAFIIDNAAGILTWFTFQFEKEHLHPYVEHKDRHRARLCRHKIISATQCAIIFCASLRPTATDKEIDYGYRQPWTPAILEINALFAHFMAQVMLRQWFAYYQYSPAVINYLRDESLTQLYAENLQCLQHLGSLGVNEKNALHFPHSLISQVWYLIERLCQKA